MRVKTIRMCVQLTAKYLITNLTNFIPFIASRHLHDVADKLNNFLIKTMINVAWMVMLGTFDCFKEAIVDLLYDLTRDLSNNRF